MFTTSIPSLLAVLEKRIQESGSKSHITGDSWTIADFFLAAHFTSLYLNEACEISAPLKAALDTFPNLKQYAEILQSEFKDYLAIRPVRPF